MTASILQLRALPTYQQQLEAFSAHVQSCDDCSDHSLCEVGIEMCFLAWALMCPLPRPSARRAAGRRRSS